MLASASWLPLAERLNLPDNGRSRRANHDCGDGRTLQLSREAGFFRAWCHRCNDGGSHRIEEPTHVRLARLAAQQRADSAATAQRAVVPAGCSDLSQWPTEARLWFARAGLHAGDAGRIGAVYDHSTARVILPCGEGFWQGRAVHKGQQPKYLAPFVDKVYPRYGKEQPWIVLTEDILSAYKVSKAGYWGWCMLGTALPTQYLSAILSDKLSVHIWLDNDLPPTHHVNRGQVAARKIIKTFQSLGVVHRNHLSDRDPKLLSLATIKDTLA